MLTGQTNSFQRKKINLQRKIFVFRSVTDVLEMLTFQSPKQDTMLVKSHSKVKQSLFNTSCTSCGLLSSPLLVLCFFFLQFPFDSTFRSTVTCMTDLERRNPVRHHIPLS